MKKLLWLWPLLSGCGQNTAEHQAARQPALPQTQRPAAPAKPDTAYTSGDRATAGPLDTLHVARGVVLRLVPGSKNDFEPEQAPLEYAEARLIRREGDGRVQRLGSTLLVRPFNSRVLRFTDSTYEMRKDDNEEADSHCRFLGSIPGQPYWLVDSVLWEREVPFLIHKASGRITKLLSQPDTSPDRKLLFATSPGLDPESGGGFLEHLSITSQSVIPRWRRELHHWLPLRARWLSNHTIAIEQFRFEPKDDTTYVRLLLPH